MAGLACTGDPPNRHRGRHRADRRCCARVVHAVGDAVVGGWDAAALIGMCYQVCDTTVRDRRIRRTLALDVAWPPQILRGVAGRRGASAAHRARRPRTGRPRSRAWVLPASCPPLRERLTAGFVAQRLRSPPARPASKRQRPAPLILRQDHRRAVRARFPSRRSDHARLLRPHVPALLAVELGNGTR
jgi:hypothetical protein